MAIYPVTSRDIRVKKAAEIPQSLKYGISGNDAFNKLKSGGLIPDNAEYESYNDRTGVVSYKVPMTGDEALSALKERGEIPQDAVLDSYNGDTGELKYTVPSENIMPYQPSKATEIIETQINKPQQPTGLSPYEELIQAGYSPEQAAEMVGGVGAKPEEQPTSGLPVIQGSSYSEAQIAGINKQRESPLIVNGESPLSGKELFDRAIFEGIIDKDAKFIGVDKATGDILFQEPVAYDISTRKPVYIGSTLSMTPIAYDIETRQPIYEGSVERDFQGKLLKLQETLGRQPTLGEYIALRMDEQGIEPNVFETLPVIGMFVIGVEKISTLLGNTRPVYNPTTNKVERVPLEGVRYWDAKRQAEREYYSIYPGSIYEEATTQALTELGAPASKALLPQIEAKDVSAMEWLQTGVTVGTATLPFTKGVVSNVLLSGLGGTSAYATAANWNKMPTDAKVVSVITDALFILPLIKPTVGMLRDLPKEAQIDAALTKANKTAKAANESITKLRNTDMSSPKYAAVRDTAFRDVSEAKTANLELVKLISEYPNMRGSKYIVNNEIMTAADNAKLANENMVVALDKLDTGAALMTDVEATALVQHAIQAARLADEAFLSKLSMLDKIDLNKLKKIEKQSGFVGLEKAVTDITKAKNKIEIAWDKLEALRIQPKKLETTQLMKARNELFKARAEFEQSLENFAETTKVRTPESGTPTEPIKRDFSGLGETEPTMIKTQGTIVKEFGGIKEESIIDLWAWNGGREWWGKMFKNVGTVRPEIGDTVTGAGRPTLDDIFALKRETIEAKEPFGYTGIRQAELGGASKPFTESKPDVFSGGVRLPLFAETGEPLSRPNIGGSTKVLPTSTIGETGLSLGLEQAFKVQGLKAPKVINSPVTGSRYFLLNTESLLGDVGEGATVQKPIPSTVIEALGLTESQLAGTERITDSQVELIAAASGLSKTQVVEATATGILPEIVYQISVMPDVDTLLKLNMATDTSLETRIIPEIKPMTIPATETRIETKFKTEMMPVTEQTTKTVDEITRIEINEEPRTPIRTTTIPSDLGEEPSENESERKPQLGDAVFKMGEPKGGAMWYVIPPPYKLENMYAIRHKPQLATKDYSGVGSARRTFQILGGEAANDADIDVGSFIAMIRINKQTGGTTLDFRRDETEDFSRRITKPKNLKNWWDETEYQNDDTALGMRTYRGKRLLPPEVGGNI